MTNKQIREAVIQSSVDEGRGESFKTDKSHNTCLVCKKRYKFPNYPYKPRDIICFTCENSMRHTAEKFGIEETIKSFERAYEDIN